MTLKEEDLIKMRSLKVGVENDASRLEDIVDALTQQYIKDLDNFIATIKTAVESKQLSDEEVENIALKIPVYMYFATEGVENIGLALDSSKMTKQQRYNEMFDLAQGTIQDKKTQAELQAMPEYYMEIVFSRAYKRLKSKLDVCEHLCLSIRKIIGKRTQDLFIASQEIED